MPGMVNPHAHLAMTLFRGLGEDVDDRLFRYVLPMERKFVTPEMVRVGTALRRARIHRGRRHDSRRHVLLRDGGRPRLDRAGMRGVVGQTLANFDPPDHKTIDEGFARVEELVHEFAGSRQDRSVHRSPCAVLHRHRRMARVARWAKDHPDVPVQLHLAEMDSEMEWCRTHHDLRPVAVVEKAGLLLPGLIAAHCLHLDPTRSSGWRRRMCASPTTHGRTRRRAAASRPSRPCAAAGIRVGIATDGPMSGNTLDLFSQFGPVSMFQKLLGHSRKPMPAAQVIRMATLEGAQVLGLDSKHRLAGVRQAGGSHPHRSLCAANAAHLRHLRDTRVLGDAS